MSVLDCLIGTTVKYVNLSKDKTNLSFVTDLGDFNFYSDGDCCSNSWIEHLNGEQELIGKKVNKVIEREIIVHINHPEYGCLQIYSFTLETDSGRFDIEMRNESNGYYGGYLRLM